VTGRVVQHGIAHSAPAGRGKCRNQQMEAEWQRQWEQQQPMPRQTICQNVGGFLTWTTY
jgi:hypothetical protein